jgi:nicotinamidase-related amidase
MILLVVDMQPKFKASGRRWLLSAVAREVRAAKSAGWGIMFLEYTRCRDVGGVPLKERTRRRLTDLVADYSEAVVVHKERDDGSAAVLHAAERWYSEGAGNERHLDGGIRVVGVNTEACVADTVNGLSAAMPGLEITVVGDACNAFGGKAPSNDGQEQIVIKDRNVRVLAVPRLQAGVARPQYPCWAGGARADLRRVRLRKAGQALRQIAQIDKAAFRRLLRLVRRELHSAEGKAAKRTPKTKVTGSARARGRSRATA